MPEWWDRLNDVPGGNALRYYLGPAYEPLGQAANVLRSISPGADMIDMHEQSADLMDARSWGDAGKAGLGLAAATMGMAIPGTAKGISEGVEEVGKGIRAYHGSPHDFDKFSMDKIGTGEGAQAYGHGLYFADKEAVAKSYRDALTHDSGAVHVQTPYRDGLIDNSPRTHERFMAARLRENKGDLPATIAQLQADLAANPGDKTITAALEFAQTPGAAFDIKDFNPGRMYEVNINANPDDFLDWDKPLSEQPEFFDKFTSAYGGEDALLARSREFEDFSGRVLEDSSLMDEWDAMRKDPRVRLGGIVENIRKPVNPYGYDAGSKQTGESLYRAMSPDRTKAAAALREAGIPGLKYLDAGSRTAGDGSRNYVVFDDNLVNILRKYGLAGLLAGGAAGGNALRPDEEQY
jgi:hypothetical protein